MIWHEDDKEDYHYWAVPTLGVLIVAAVGCLVLFWLPLFLYVWHWWLT